MLTPEEVELLIRLRWERQQSPLLPTELATKSPTQCEGCCSGGRLTGSGFLYASAQAGVLCWHLRADPAPAAQTGAAKRSTTFPVPPPTPEQTKTPETKVISGAFQRAGDGGRTRDPRLGKPMLYR